MGYVNSLLNNGNAEQYFTVEKQKKVSKQWKFSSYFRL